MAEPTEPIATRREPVIEVVIFLIVVGLLVWQMWGASWTRIGFSVLGGVILSGYWQVARWMRDVQTWMRGVEDRLDRIELTLRTRG